MSDDERWAWLGLVCKDGQEPTYPGYSRVRARLRRSSAGWQTTDTVEWPTVTEEGEWIIVGISRAWEADGLARHNRLPHAVLLSPLQTPLRLSADSVV